MRQNSWHWSGFHAAGLFARSLTVTLQEEVTWQVKRAQGVPTSFSAISIPRLPPFP
ncbi:hypothetical protein AGR4C_Lc40129 [Agrobacterium tumefaciens str. Kerr 14]|uniref:Uncharacterized protein n=1 Tax=Agrobacterium tumefaciens str. Kerr 14 TaxID=1183424 RepID=A0A1S7RKQ8_AGRTU|nr:hypothetical protein AGR4C_Lc40129 [Agrobacterium tumefaciens str. Kerr 14]